MKNTTVACLTLLVTLLPSCTPAAKEESKPVITHVTAELRDGSRVVGVFAATTLALDSVSVGELKMPVERIRVVEWPSDKKPAQLQAANGDKFAVELRLTELPITSSFGEIKVPVGKIRELRFWTDAGGTNHLPGLVALWSGEGDARDSVSGQTATLAGGMSYVPGKVGQAFSFDGSTGYVDFGTEIGNSGVKDFTFSFWINTKTTRMVHVISKRMGCYNCNFLDIGLGQRGIGDGKINFSVVKGSDYATAFLGNHALNDGVFHHVAVTRQEKLYQVFVDGVLDTSGNTSELISFNNAAPLLGGTGPCTGVDGSQSFQGQLDELSFYNRALSADEIRRLFDAGNSNQR